MAYEDNELPNRIITLTNANYKILSRHMISLRRHKMPTIYLDGKKPKRVLKAWFKGIKLRWVKLKYMCMLRKLKEYYKSLVKDFIEAGDNLETIQQRLLLEALFAVPVMGTSFSRFPVAAGSDRPRTLVL